MICQCGSPVREWSNPSKGWFCAGCGGYLAEAISLRCLQCDRLIRPEHAHTHGITHTFAFGQKVWWEVVQ